MSPTTNRIQFAYPLSVPTPNRLRRVMSLVVLYRPGFEGLTSATTPQTGLVYPRVAQMKDLPDRKQWPDLFWGHHPLSAVSQTSANGSQDMSSFAQHNVSPEFLCGTSRLTSAVIPGCTDIPAHPVQEK